MQDMRAPTWTLWLGLALGLAACEGTELNMTPTVDAGAADSDAGAVEADTGVVEDAGVIEADAGVADDAGVEADAGQSEPDAGQPADAGPPPARTPPPIPLYSEGACPTLMYGPTSAAGLNTGFMSGGYERQFRVLVPDNYDGTQDWPVVFAWHWLNASSNSFVQDGELESATAEMGFIAVLPDKRLRDNGNKAYQFDWPFVEVSQAESELVFFDDMLACVSEQLRVDAERIYGIGVSAGALWLTHLSTTDRVEHFAALESLSGGLGDVAGLWRMEYQPQTNKFPALVLWGGERDWLGVNFNDASQRYRDALMSDGHFVLECVHDAGHAMPPIEPPPGAGTKFWSLWRFMLDHPYGLPAGTSPYQASGIPGGFPDWCRIP